MRAFDRYRVSLHGGEESVLAWKAWLCLRSYFFKLKYS